MLNSLGNSNKKYTDFYFNNFRQFINKIPELQIFKVFFFSIFKLYQIFIHSSTEWYLYNEKTLKECRDHYL